MGVTVLFNRYLIKSIGYKILRKNCIIYTAHFVNLLDVDVADEWMGEIFRQQH